MSRLTYPKFSAQNVSGLNLSGGLVYFYEAGTSTPKDTFSDEAFETENTNPVILDSRGEADIFLNGIYKIILKDADDVEIWTEDNFELPLSSQWGTLVPATFVSTTSFTVTGDLTADFEQYRRIKCNDATTLYGVITSSSYSAPDTTVTVTLDSGVLSSSLKGIELSILTVANPAIPESISIASLTTTNLTTTNLTTTNLTAAGSATISGNLKLSKGADIASAAALALGTDGNYFDVTGTTTITSISTAGIGTVIKLHFDDALTLTHDATNLILPSEANITTVAGDEAEFIEYAAGDWRCINYSKASGSAITGLPYMHVRDEKPSGTTGGASVVGSNTRTLNTVLTNTIAGASLSSNQITLPAGTYKVYASAPAYSAEDHRLILYNATDTANEILGTGEYARTLYTVSNRSFVSGLVIITASEVFDLRHIMAAVNANGLGIASNDGNVEVYAQISIERIA